MKRSISLKLLLILAFASLGLLLIFGYSILSVHFFIQGLDAMTAGTMEQTARSYLQTTSLEQQQQRTEFSGYTIAPSWKQLPGEIRQAFGRPPSTSNHLVKHADAHWPGPPKNFYFLLHYRKGERTFFIARKVTHTSGSHLVGQSAMESRRTLIVLSLSIALTLGLVVLLLVRHLSRPVAALGNWASALNPERLKEPPPDFSYPELNQLAALIRTSLSQVQDSLEREHRFLRHTSHELRTPISVIRSNIALMHKLQERELHPLDPRELQVIQRIDRASLTMKHLTETLLWLSRNDSEQLPTTTLRLDQLIRQLVEDTRYLLPEEVAVVVETTPCSIRVSEIPARIVLGNVIRNAFQHTFAGTVGIKQIGNGCFITNPQNTAEEGQQDLGFGLGLELTRQLTTRLGWHYEVGGEAEHYLVRLQLGTIVAGGEAQDVIS